MTDSRPGTGDASVSMLTFRVDGVSMAVPSAIVAEVARELNVTRVPHAPACVDGVASARGLVLPVISAAKLFGRAATRATATSRAIVIDLDRPFALTVDAVVGLDRREAMTERQASVYVSEGQAVHIIDLEDALRAAFGEVRSSAGTKRGAEVAPQSIKEVATTRILTFVVAGQIHALPIENVVEVVNVPEEVAALPHGERADLGVIAYRLGVLPIVDLATLMGLGATAGAGKLVVARIGAALVGLRVDSLQVILSVPNAAIDPAPALLNRGGGEAGVAALVRIGNDRVVSLLEPERLFRTEALLQIMADGRQELDTVADDTTQDAETFLIFELGGETYGLPIAEVEEVVTAPETLTRVPNAPAFIEGVMSLRGKVVPIIDQGRRFGAAFASTTVRKVIVTTAGDLRAGFVVDAVSEIRSIAAIDLAPASELLADDRAIFDRVARNPDGTVTLIANARSLLDQAEADVLAALSAELGASL